MSSPRAARVLRQVRVREDGRRRPARAGRRGHPFSMPSVPTLPRLSSPPPFQAARSPTRALSSLAGVDKVRARTKRARGGQRAPGMPECVAGVTPAATPRLGPPARARLLMRPRARSMRGVARLGGGRGRRWGEALGQERKTIPPSPRPPPPPPPPPCPHVPPRADRVHQRPLRPHGGEPAGEREREREGGRRGGGGRAQTAGQLARTFPPPPSPLPPRSCAAASTAR